MQIRFAPIVASLLLSTTAFAAAPKTYQVTGVVKAITDTTVTVVTTKGKETWEIAKDDATKVTGTLKEGAKVTIEYRMTATKVDVKDAAKAK